MGISANKLHEVGGERSAGSRIFAARFNRSLPVMLALSLAIFLAMGLGGCASLVASAGGGLAGNLTVAMMNQDDPVIVRDGAPAYLLMLDSFVEGSPQNEAVLAAAAELYAAYGVVFVHEPGRAKRHTSRARSYGQRALCAVNKNGCGIWDLPFEDFEQSLRLIRKKDVGALYTFGLGWIAYIRAHSDEYSALAKLPLVEATLLRVEELDPAYEAARVEHFLGILNTIRPPALGGDFPAGLAHFERALEISGEKDLAIKVDFARYYARTLYDRELHDKLLNEVISTEPEQRGYTLFNMLAQEEAQELLASADDYF